MTDPANPPGRYIPAYIHRIRIRDLGPIAEREIHFERGITLLLGDNNVGKSTVLRAIQLALGPMRAERSDIRCRSQDNRPVPQPCAVIDLHIRLAGDPDDESISGLERDLLERVSNTFSSGIVPGPVPEVFVRTVIGLSTVGDSEDTTVERIFLPAWADFPPNSSSIDTYTNDSKGSATQALTNVFECFTLDVGRNLADETQQRRSNWGRVVSNAGYPDEARMEIEGLIETLGKRVISSSERLSSAEVHVAKLSKHFKSAVREVTLHSVNPDPDALARDTELHVQDTVGPKMPLRLQGSGIKSAASIMAFEARTNLPRLVGQIRCPILLLEEPEAHLHPVAQRSIAQLLNELNGQRIITSHSPSIATQLAAATDFPLTALRILRSTAGEGVVPRVVEDSALAVETEKALRVMRNNQGECFFAASVIVGEGSTEQFALPVFADEFFGETDSLARRAVTLLGAGSKNSIPGVLRLLAALGIPAFGLVDSDGEKGVRGFKYAVSEGDWELALVAEPSRLSAIWSQIEPDLRTYKSELIRGAENRAMSQNIADSDRALAAQTVVDLNVISDDQLAVRFLQRYYKNESVAVLVTQMLANLRGSSKGKPEAPDHRFPKAVLEVLRFVESPLEV